MGLRGWFWVNSAPFFKLNPFKTVLDPSSAGKWPKIAKTKMYILVSSQTAATFAVKLSHGSKTDSRDKESCSCRPPLGWAGHLPDHLADLAARAPKLKNVTDVAPWTT